MSSKPLAIRSPLSFLAVASLGVLVIGLYSRASHRARLDDAPAGDCGGPTPQRCEPALEAGDTLGSLDVAGPPLSESEVCGDVGYLCSQVEAGESLRLWRWPEDTPLIRVLVPVPVSLPPGLARDFQEAAVRGLRAWQGHPFPLSIRTRGGGEPPNATVQWTRALEEGRLGRAQVEWSRIGDRVRVLVLGLAIATHEPGKGGGLLTPRQIELVATHEMGHVLGLPHSDDPRDVMYPQNTAIHLTARDFRTLEALYALPNGIEIRP